MVWTFGVFGMTEWIADLPVGKGSVSVPFTGGCISAMGEVPATFSTRNAFMANLIMKSQWYEKKKILPLWK